MLRSDRLLFAYLAEEDAYLIDVLPHKRTDGGIAWADKEILETLCREWPSVMERYVHCYQLRASTYEQLPDDLVFSAPSSGGAHLSGTA